MLTSSGGCPIPLRLSLNPGSGRRSLSLFLCKGRDR